MASLQLLTRITVSNFYIFTTHLSFTGFYVLLIPLNTMECNKKQEITLFFTNVSRVISLKKKKKSELELKNKFLLPAFPIKTKMKAIYNSVTAYNCRSLSLLA